MPGWTSAAPGTWPEGALGWTSETWEAAGAEGTWPEGALGWTSETWGAAGAEGTWPEGALGWTSEAFERFLAKGTRRPDCSPWGSGIRPTAEQMGQNQSPAGCWFMGGTKHVVCQPLLQLSHNNMFSGCKKDLQISHLCCKVGRANDLFTVGSRLRRWQGVHCEE